MTQSHHNHRASDPSVSASAWMDLDDDGLAKAMDAAFEMGEAETGGDNQAASLLAFASLCRGAFGVDGAAEELDAAAESEELRARRVSARVLARTTHGDRDGGVIDFVSEKLRRSPLLRVAAAVLLVQVTVVPLIAWHLTQQPQPDGFLTGIEPPPEVFEQDLPRERESIEEVETRHAELLGLDSSLSSVILDLDIPAEDSSVGTDSSAVGKALGHLARVALDSQFVLGAVPTGSLAGDELLVLSLDLEARLIAFDNARRSAGLSASIQALSDTLGSAERANPAHLAIASMALLRASSLNLAVPDVPLGGGSLGKEWVTALGDALAGCDPSPGVDRWQRAIAAR